MPRQVSGGKVPQIYVLVSLAPWEEIYANTGVTERLKSSLYWSNLGQVKVK